MNKYIDGKAISSEIQETIKSKVEEYTAKGLRKPGLATLLVGNNPASQSYIRSKIKKSEYVGFNSFHKSLGEDASIEEVMKTIEEWNNSEEIDGILVQLPLPLNLAKYTNDIMLAIDPEKDVDGFHPYNIGLLVKGEPRFIPCTPRGIIELLKHEKIETTGKKAVIIGRSQIVGLPVGLLLLMKNEYGNATVTYCHSRTKNLDEEIKQADILIAAIGKPQFVKSNMIKEGVTIIDVGINRIEDSNSKKGYRIVGDVDTEDVLPKVSRITPVPGGVGPMTITMLLENTLESYERKLSK